MKIGVVFPQTEIGADPAGVRDYVQAAESLGYDHLVAFDHVIGANAASRPGWSGSYDSKWRIRFMLPKNVYTSTSNVTKWDLV